MKLSFPTVVAAVASVTIAGSASATLVTVEITGEVEYNQVGFGAFAAVNPGDAASISFTLDSDVFMDSGSFPTRGYEIDTSSYVMTLGSVSVGLQNPYPATPYFVLRNNDPAVDGFFIADSTDFPIGVSLDEPGGFDPQFKSNFSVGYTGDTLDSLDLLDAVGTYDFTGLTNFNFTVDDGPFQPIGMIFEQMTISVVPTPGTFAVLAPLALAGRRRRRG